MASITKRIFNGIIGGKNPRAIKIKNIYYEDVKKEFFPIDIVPGGHLVHYRENLAIRVNTNETEEKMRTNTNETDEKMRANTMGKTDENTQIKKPITKIEEKTLAKNAIEIEEEKKFENIDIDYKNINKDIIEVVEERKDYNDEYITTNEMPEKNVKVNLQNPEMKKNYTQEPPTVISFNQPLFEQKNPVNIQSYIPDKEIQKRCSLCFQPCSLASDSFHPLCGKSHKCIKLCQKEGSCGGKGKLCCVLEIPPGLMCHEGNHHCEELFHSCNTKCPMENCGTYCKKSPGHDGLHKGESLHIDGDSGNCNEYCSTRSHIHNIPCNGEESCLEFKFEDTNPIGKHSTTMSSSDEISCDLFWKYYGWEKINN